MLFSWRTRYWAQEDQHSAQGGHRRFHTSFSKITPSPATTKAPLPALGPPFHKQPAKRTRGERGGGGGDWHAIPERGCTHLTPGRELGRWPFIWAREPVPAAPYTGDRSRAAGRYGPDHRHRPRAREAPSPPPSPCDQLPERRAETGGAGRTPDVRGT